MKASLRRIKQVRAQFWKRFSERVCGVDMELRKLLCWYGSTPQEKLIWINSASVYGVDMKSIVNKLLRLLACFPVWILDIAALAISNYRGSIALDIWECDLALWQWEDCLYVFPNFNYSFDGVSHTVFITKLRLLRMGNMLLSWIWESSTGRLMRFVFSGVVGPSEDVTSVVPQRSLFILIYANRFSSRMHRVLKLLYMTWSCV